MKKIDVGKIILKNDFSSESFLSSKNSFSEIIILFFSLNILKYRLNTDEQI